METFAEWQARYAEHGIPTFPVRGKVPAICNYLRLGLSGSAKLVARFGDATAFGFAPERAGIVVLDVDTPRESVLADALARHGDTPFVVRTGSGNYQAWYLRTGERRHIRPDPDLPIDVLGGGFVVAPPSVGPNGPYRIIRGSLDDLAHLPRLTNPPPSCPPPRGVGRPERSTGVGRRNDTLWRLSMEQARHCDDLDALLDVARSANADFDPPLPDDEVVKLARSAWSITERGENRFGDGRHVLITHDEVDRLLSADPDAFLLLSVLRRHHWARDFVLANAMARQMPGGGWTEKRLARARRSLEAAGKIQLLRSAGKHRGPALYRLRSVASDMTQ